MGKVIKFEPEGNFENEKNENTFDSDVLRIKKAIEDHILENFAVKTVLGMDISYKINKNDVGVIGKLSYHHKRREGMFIAEFIAKGSKIKDNIFIDTVAFKAGEPQLYNQLVNILKAKKSLPEGS